MFNESKDLITVEDYDLWLNIALKNGVFGFCEDFLESIEFMGQTYLKTLIIISKPKKLIMLHVFEIQNFSNSKELWKIIEPRLKVIRINHYLRRNIYIGLKFLAIELISSEISKSISLIKILMKKLLSR